MFAIDLEPATTSDTMAERDLGSDNFRYDVRIIEEARIATDGILFDLNRGGVRFRGDLVSRDALINAMFMSLLEGLTYDERVAWGERWLGRLGAIMGPFTGGKSAKRGPKRGRKPKGTSDAGELGLPEITSEVNEPPPATPKKRRKPGA